MSHLIKCAICHFTKIHKMYKMLKTKMMKMQTCVKILRLLGGVHFSALKPGPVVPPGTQKVPNQAARKTQTVDFGHLSDILAFFGVPQFLTLFFTFFTFHFCHFFCFSVFHFCWFLSFYDFLIFVTFHVFVNFINFVFFYSFFAFFNFSKGMVKIRPSFDLFLAPTSTPMASTWRGSFLNVKFDHSFLSVFHDFDSFLIIFCHFLLIFRFCH